MMTSNKNGLLLSRWIQQMTKRRRTVGPFIAKLNSVTEYKNSLAAETEIEWDFNLCHNNISIDCKVDYLPMATTTNDSTQSSLSLNKHSNLSLY